MVNGDGRATEFIRKCAAKKDDLFRIVVRDKGEADRWTQMNTSKREVNLV
jgi:hypothetical protein